MLRSLRLAAAGAMVFGLSGCASEVGQSLNTGFQQFSNSVAGVFGADGYLNDETDVCIAERRELAEHGQFFDPEIARSVLIGAGTGGLAALLAGENVLVGAGVGAGIGLAAGYLNKLQSEGLSGTQITTQARTDVATANQRIDRLLVSFDELSACRKREGAAVQSAFVNGLPRADAEAEMAAVRERFRQDKAKFAELADQIGENSEAYAGIYNEIAADNGGRAMEVRPYGSPRRSARIVRRPAEKQTTIEEGTLDADAAEVEALQRECLTNVRKRDDCFDRVKTAEAEEEEFELG